MHIEVAQGEICIRWRKKTVFQKISRDCRFKGRVVTNFVPLVHQSILIRHLFNLTLFLNIASSSQVILELVNRSVGF
jgi:hypothetical protein